jgi:DNA-binding protein YbaB
VTPVDNPYETLLAQARDFGRTENPEAALRRMQDSMSQVQDRIEQVRTAKATATDPSGTVSATVTGEGKLLQVEIGGKALRDLPGAELGTACVAAIRAARIQMAEELRKQLTELVGRPMMDPTALPSVTDAMRQAAGKGGPRWS